MSTVSRFPAVLAGILNNQHLTSGLAEALMRDLMAGSLTSAQIAALAVAIRAKGETEDELVGFARAMRAGAVVVHGAPADAVDTCGTGGDNLHTFNISTAAAFVAAGAGVTVAKHGNRAASSKSGSADVLEALGVNLDMPVARISECLHSIGIAFLFARAHHPALKHAAAARSELGIRTFFNLLGPLTNPAGARIQLIGLCAGVRTAMMARVLAQLGAERAMVVHGFDGMDEITLTGPTEISELKDNDVFTYTVKPEDFGFVPCAPAQLAGGDPSRNAEIVMHILRGVKGPHSEIVLLNAGAVIYLAGKAPTHAAGIALAHEAIASGAAARKLNQLVEFSVT